MHKCLKCGKEFDGNFCPECGEKFVENAVCPKCGAKTEPADKFCRICGEKLVSVTEQPEALRAQGTAVKDKTLTGEKIKKAIYLSGMVCILLSALMGFVFTFVCGFSVKNGGEVVGTSMLYDYFGVRYDRTGLIEDEILSLFEWRSIGSARKFALYFPVVLGTVISAVGILAAVALSVLTAYKAYQKFYNKKEVNVIASAAATYLTFAALATLLLVLNSAEEGGVKSVFSNATLGGLITGGVLLGLGLLLVAGSKYKTFLNFKAQFGSGMAVAVSAFAVVIVAVMVLPAVAMRVSAMGYTVLNEGCGLLSGTQGMLLLFGDDNTVYEIMGYGITGGCLMIALAIISFVILYRKISGVTDGKNKGTLVLNIVSALLAVAVLVFSILFVNAIVDDAAAAGASAGKDYTVPIVLVVMSALALACEIVGKVVAVNTQPE